MTTDPRKAYRQQLMQTESLPEIFVHAYDRVVGLLHSAAAATEARDISAKTLYLNQALDIMVHLQAALNFEQGGDVALSLNRFYTLVRQDIFKGSARLDAGILREAADHVVEVRKIWEQAQSLSAAANAANPAAAQQTSTLPRESDAYAHEPASPANSSIGWSA